NSHQRRRGRYRRGSACGLSYSRTRHMAAGHLPRFPWRMDPTHRQGPAGSEREFWRGVAYSSRFFMGDADVQRALRKIVKELEEAKIPYAIAGAMALNWYGYRRVTVDVALLLKRDGLRLIRAAKLPRELGRELHPYVQAKYDELWLAVQAAGDEDY